MNTKAAILISLLTVSFIANAQKVSRVYKIDELRKRINGSDSTLVVNFWATWCKPCIEELTSFDSLVQAEPKLKVLLVSLDFREDLEKKVNPFLKNKNILSECVLLDEVNGNDFVNKISPQWSGAIPATLFKKGANEKLLEKKMRLAELRTIAIELR